MSKFFDAFISYGRADSKDFATKLQACLDEQGLNVWFDFNDIPLGVDFQNQINDGIEKAHHFIFIIAPHSVNSEYCLKEIELAIKCNKRIIPLLHVMQISRETWQQRKPHGTDEDWEAYQAKGLHDSYQNMHPIIRKLNWVYFEEGKYDFEKSLADLVKLLASHADYVQLHTKFLVKALEWERHKKQTSYLLVGEEIQQAQTWLQRHFKDEQPPCIPNDLHCEYITESIKNANNLMTQVFLCYSDHDRATMEKVRNSLRRESITVWTNRTDIKTGEDFKAAINHGIEQADNIVYLLSPDAVKSTYCQQELDLAVSLNKRVIPLLVRETEPTQIPLALRDLQYIDFTDNVKEEDYHLDESQLLKILYEDAAYYTEHKILLTKALNWGQQQNNPSILLRGYNLRSAETWLKVAQKRTLHPPTALQAEYINESLQQPPLESLDVFISYSRADADLARKLNDALQTQGKTTWFDQESIASGCDFKEEIYRGIKTCDNFLFIISPRSLNSPYCKDEVAYASSLNKRFVTLLHREVDTADLHPDLAKVQWIDFNHHDRDFNANFNQLIRTLDTDREHVHSHSKWLQRALEWEQQDKNDDLLLRGSEFLIAQSWLEKTEQEHKKPVATVLHKEFIEVSKKAIAAAKEQEQHRQAEMLRLQSERAKEAEARLAEQKKSAKRQKFFLVAISMALVAAVGLALIARQEKEKAENAQQEQLNSVSRFSSSLSLQNLQFDAVLEAIKAGEKLQYFRNKQISPTTQSLILTALQTAVYGNGFREQNRLHKHSSTVFSISFSPDNQKIATASADGTIDIWSLDGQSINNIPVGKSTNVYSVSFSRDGKIASGDGDKTVKLWSQDGKLLQTFTGHTGAVNSVVWSPDGNIIASAGDDKTVQLWSKQGKLGQILTDHQKPITQITFSPDGQTIATASKDGRIILWTLDGQKSNIFGSLNCCQQSKALVYSVSFSPDGNTIASGHENGIVKLWSKESKSPQIIKAHNAVVRSVGWSPDGNTIASASDDKTVKLWNQNGQEINTLKGHQAAILSVQFSDDGHTIATSGEDNSVRFWRKVGKELPTIQTKNPVWTIASSPNGQTIAFGGKDNTVQLCNQSGKCRVIFQHQDAVSSISFSPDGNIIASASKDNTIKLWNQPSKILKTLRGHQGDVWSLAWSPDGNTIVSGSEDKTVILWNKNGDKLHTLKGHRGVVWSVAWSPDGNTIASGSQDRTIMLWKKNGDKLHTLTGHQSDIASLSFSPDSKMLASASTDNSVKLWSQGKNFQQPTTLKTHRSDVLSVAFSPDGNMIASASKDNTIKLWNTDGDELQTLLGHNQRVTSVKFSPDGKTLLSAGDDGKVILWNLADLQLDKLMQDACTQVRDYLKYNAPESDRQLCQP